MTTEHTNRFTEPSIFDKLWDIATDEVMVQLNEDLPIKGPAHKEPPHKS